MSTRIEHIEVTLRFGRRLRLPAWVIDSSRPGPFMLLTAAQHGNEVQGSEAVRRFVEMAAPLVQAGRIAAVPFVNVPALRERRPHVGMKPEQPYERDGGLNMNRAWPGSAGGTPMARIAHALWQAFGAEATHALDIHSWHKHAAPAILLHDRPGMREIARQIGHRFVDMRPLSPQTLVGNVCLRGGLGLTYECAGQYAVDEEQVGMCLRVIVNLSRLIGLLPGTPEPPDGPALFSDECQTVHVTAPCPGLFVKGGRRLCDAVAQGEELGHILSADDLRRQPVFAPAAGYLKGFGVFRPDCDVAITGHHPYVSGGERLATVVWQRNGAGETSARPE